MHTKKIHSRAQSTRFWNLVKVSITSKLFMLQTSLMNKNNESKLNKEL